MGVISPQQKLKLLEFIERAKLEEKCFNLALPEDVKVGAWQMVWEYLISIGNEKIRNIADLRTQFTSWRHRIKKRLDENVRTGNGAVPPLTDLDQRFYDIFSRVKGIAHGRHIPNVRDQVNLPPSMSRNQTSSRHSYAPNSPSQLATRSVPIGYIRKNAASVSSNRQRQLPSATATSRSRTVQRSPPLRTSSPDLSRSQLPQLQHDLSAISHRRRRSPTHIPCYSNARRSHPPTSTITSANQRDRTPIRHRQVTPADVNARANQPIPHNCKIMIKLLFTYQLLILIF